MLVSAPLSVDLLSHFMLLTRCCFYPFEGFPNLIGCPHCHYSGPILFIYSPEISVKNAEPRFTCAFWKERKGIASSECVEELGCNTAVA